MKSKPKLKPWEITGRMAAIGRIGGLRKSEAKTVANRLNIAKRWAKARTHR